MSTGGMYTTESYSGRGSGRTKDRDRKIRVIQVRLYRQTGRQIQIWTQEIEYIVLWNENLQGQRQKETGRYERQKLYRQTGIGIDRDRENKVQYTEDLEGQEQIETGRDEDRDGQIGKEGKIKGKTYREKHSRHSPTPRGKGRGGVRGGKYKIASTAQMTRQISFIKKIHLYEIVLLNSNVQHIG